MFLIGASDDDDDGDGDDGGSGDDDCFASDCEVGLLGVDLWAVALVLLVVVLLLLIVLILLCWRVDCSLRVVGDEHTSTPLAQESTGDEEGSSS